MNNCTANHFSRTGTNIVNGSVTYTTNVLDANFKVGEL